MLVGESIRNFGKDVGFGDGVFGVRSVGEGHDARAFGKALHVAAEFNDFTGEVAAEDGREVERHASFGGAAAEFVVDGVDAGGVYFYQDFVVAGFGVGTSSYFSCSGPP